MHSWRVALRGHHVLGHDISFDLSHKRFLVSDFHVDCEIDVAILQSR